MKVYLEKLIQGNSLTMEEMRAATLACLSDTVTDSQIAAFLTALQAKGETAEEIAGLTDFIRANSTFQMDVLDGVMDNCGTGGDQSGSFNISTTAAFVIAGAGITIAKYGNRSVSSKTGSADVLEHLGVSLFFTKQQIKEALTNNQIAFLFAPHVHQTLKPFGKVRNELGLPTIFNMIGPLTNPVQLNTQLIGVYREDKLELIASALKKLGRQRAVVVHGAGGMDEASLSGTNHLIVLEEKELKRFTLHPNDVNLPVYPNQAIQGGTAKENAAITLSVLQGQPSAYLDTVLLNAGLGIYAQGAAATIQTGIEMARKSITSGNALTKLERLRTISEKFTSEVG
ncbi:MULTISPECIES: anthranilate phosphoribosyltransferase [unclassified Virgibacillus]|uniref:anthranilate phosphoribosyltransferase n=1 Tax=unclassified Virgibacillus TaxID=2620237 RepID=UPI00090A8063|nr:MULTISPECIES: anthranilate phosphoribosyltransferase [unclassified Virgibacillus]API92872.1 anthranilate phosphoribosyltransferase [Virgibacillus sp. 6R]MBS7428385.1 anthranilate phosphoribosyltransferase [Virgibacillus sp. 19R1-5]